MAGNGDGVTQQLQARLKEMKMLDLEAKMKSEVNVLEELVILRDLQNKSDAFLAEIDPHIDELCLPLLQVKLIKVETLHEVNTLNYLKVNCEWTGKAGVYADDPIADALVTHAKSLGVPVVRLSQSGEPLPEPEPEPEPQPVSMV